MSSLLFIIVIERFNFYPSTSSPHGSIIIVEMTTVYTLLFNFKIYINFYNNKASLYSQISEANSAPPYAGVS